MEEFFGKNHKAYENTKSGLGVLARSAFCGFIVLVRFESIDSGWFGANISRWEGEDEENGVWGIDCTWRELSNVHLTSSRTVPCLGLPQPNLQKLVVNLVNTFFLSN